MFEVHTNYGWKLRNMGTGKVLTFLLHHVGKKGETTQNFGADILLFITPVQKVLK